MIALIGSYLQWIPFNLRFYARVRARHFHRAALTAFNPGESFIVFGVILRCRSGVRRQLASKQKRFTAAGAGSGIMQFTGLGGRTTFTANFKDTDLKSFIETVGLTLIKPSLWGRAYRGK